MQVDHCSAEASVRYSSAGQHPGRHDGRPRPQPLIRWRSVQWIWSSRRRSLSSYFFLSLLNFCYFRLWRPFCRVRSSWCRYWLWFQSYKLTYLIAQNQFLQFLFFFNHCIFRLRCSLCGLWRSWCRYCVVTWTFNVLKILVKKITYFILSLQIKGDNIN